MANNRRTIKTQDENTEVNENADNIEMDKIDGVEIDETNQEKTSEIKETISTRQSKSKQKIKKDIPLDTLVKVINGTYGELIYVSKKTVGMRMTWSKFGDEDYLELSELVSIRNTSRKFFEQNWFLLEDQDIIDYLGVGQYYQNQINIKDFDHLFTESPKDIIEKVSHMSDGLKRTVAARAYDLIQEKQIYGAPIILALEEATGYELNY